MSDKSRKRNVNDTGTWVHPDIPSGVTVVRKENVTEDEIYEIYKECIYIQRNAYIRKQRIDEENGYYLRNQLIATPPISHRN